MTYEFTLLQLAIMSTGFVAVGMMIAVLIGMRKR